jgi:hypothetical protein
LTGDIAKWMRYIYGKLLVEMRLPLFTQPKKLEVTVARIRDGAAAGHVQQQVHVDLIIAVLRTTKPGGIVQ